MPFNNGYYLNNAFVTKFNPKGSALIYSTYLGGTTQDESGGLFQRRCCYRRGYRRRWECLCHGIRLLVQLPCHKQRLQKVNNAGLRGGSGRSRTQRIRDQIEPNRLGAYLFHLLWGSGGFSEQWQRTYTEIAPRASPLMQPGTPISLELPDPPIFPVTSNAYQKVNNAGSGAFNLFITKFNPSGSGLVYSTYLGGSGFFDGPETIADTAGGIAIDSAGDAYVTGTAYSRDFPVTANAYQKVNNALFILLCSVHGGTNAVVTELNATGSALVYSTYLGGSTGDGGNAIALDAAGNAYVTGFTYSPDFPVTSGAFQKIIRR